MDFSGFIADAFAQIKRRKPLLTRRRVAVFGTTLILAGLLIGMTLIWGWTFSLMKAPVKA